MYYEILKLFVALRKPDAIPGMQNERYRIETTIHRMLNENPWIANVIREMQYGNSGKINIIHGRPYENPGMTYIIQLMPYENHGKINIRYGRPYENPGMANIIHEMQYENSGMTNIIH